ncbi:MAG: FtsX-like permease family protein [Acidimicrobiia bacterium]|nr:FtsX-like permease family protein [Acidimicrobiia bacterium]
MRAPPPRVSCPVLLSAVALWCTLALAPAAAPGDGHPGVLLSRQLADAQGLSAGDVVRFSTADSGAGAVAFTVIGIYEPTPDPMQINASKFEARLHLPDLLAMTASPDDLLAAETVDQINVALHDPAGAIEFARHITTRVPGVQARAASSSNRGSVFVVLEQFHLAIAIVTIFASTVFLLALSVMLVDERRETVGVLRLIGLTSRRVLAQVFTEGLLIAVSGSLFGLVLALASESLINRYFQWHYDTALIFVEVTPAVAVQCLLIAVPLGVLASVAASWTLLRRQVLFLARR